jgi:extracellular factor (EF) 3-hydroxypalmitic acid methyl ester biosynthesis protein
MEFKGKARKPPSESSGRAATALRKNQRNFAFVRRELTKTFRFTGNQIYEVDFVRFMDSVLPSGRTRGKKHRIAGKEESMENVSTYPIEKRRQYPRRPYEKSIDYFLVAPEADKGSRLNLKCKTFEISDAGVGIETGYPLAPGHTVLLNGGIDRAGTVRWCISAESGYRAGIQFKTDPDYRTGFEEIQEGASFIAEEKARYQRLLDMAAGLLNSELEEIEKRCSDGRENPEVILKDIEKAFDKAMNVCAEFEQGVKDAAVIREARVRFREKTNPILSKSYLINRTRTWPQGSQGDYKTLEYAYKNTPVSDGIGYYLDLYLLNLTLGHGVRNRMKKLQAMLGDEIRVRHEPSVLNIGCGSCRELMGITPEIMDSAAKIICLDMDNDALAFAQDRLSYAGIISQVELRRYNALRMFDDEMNMTEFGRQDIIYSVGLFDYLPSDFLVKLFAALYRLLNPGGKLIASFKDAGRYRSQDYHWIVDWDGFLQRGEEDFKGFLTEAGIPNGAVEETRDDSGAIVFYLLKKA